MMDIETLKELLIAIAWATPLVAALAEVLKKTFVIPGRWMPLVAIACGIIIALLLVGLELVAIVVGIILGLGSMGLFDLSKKTIAGA